MQRRGDTQCNGRINRNGENHAPPDPERQLAPARRVFKHIAEQTAIAPQDDGSTAPRTWPRSLAVNAFLVASIAGAVMAWRLAAPVLPATTLGTAAAYVLATVVAVGAGLLHRTAHNIGGSC